MTAVATSSRRDRRRALRRASKRRTRGGHGRAPLAVQRGARRVGDGVAAVRHGVGRVFAGDRPFVIGLLVVLALGVAVVSGPLRAFLDQRAQLDVLERQAAVLAEQNEALAQRRDDLHDLDQIETRAREDLGLTFPGEVPYVIVPPEQDRPEIAPTFEVEVPEAPWFRRLWDAIADWLG